MKRHKILVNERITYASIPLSHRSNQREEDQKGKKNLRNKSLLFAF